MYGHYSLVNDVHFQDAEKQPEAGNDLKIESRAKIKKERFMRKHALAIKRAKRTQPEDISNVNDDAEVQGDDLILTKRAAIARPGLLVCINTDRAYLRSRSPGMSYVVTYTNTNATKFTTSRLVCIVECDNLNDSIT